MSWLRRGAARPRTSEAWLGSPWRSSSGPGSAWLGRLFPVRLCLARFGSARLGSARLGPAWARLGSARSAQISLAAQKYNLRMKSGAAGSFFGNRIFQAFTPRSQTRQQFPEVRFSNEIWCRKVVFRKLHHSGLPLPSLRPSTPQKSNLQMKSCATA